MTPDDFLRALTPGLQQPNGMNLTIESLSGKVQEEREKINYTLCYYGNMQVEKHFSFENYFLKYHAKE